MFFTYTDLCRNYTFKLRFLVDRDILFVYALSSANSEESLYLSNVPEQLASYVSGLWLFFVI